MDTNSQAWVLPCIDCFKRLEAVRADKEECEVDNGKLVAKNLELYADNKEYREKNDKLRKNRTWLVVTGIVTGVVGGLFIR